MALNVFDVKSVCDSLVKADHCVASAHLVGRGGQIRVSAPASVDEFQRDAIARLGRSVASGESRPCSMASIDQLMSCIAMTVGDDEALVIVFFFDMQVIGRLPRVMARAVRDLRARMRVMPPGGSSGGTPNDAHTFVAVEDLEN